jgi:nicotinamidase/pyrazinamidase
MLGRSVSVRHRSTPEALLVIDVQRDFCPGGSLAVQKGDQIVPVLNRVLALAHAHALPVYFTRDWHPPDSTHFVTGGGRWPVHCVAGSEGAKFHDDLLVASDAVLVSKGCSINSDGYSAFDGQLDDGILLADDLRKRTVGHLAVGGLATDYCVKHSVLDALQAGWNVTLLSDAIAPVELSPGDAKRALSEMQAAGAALIRSDELQFK